MYEVRVRNVSGCDVPFKAKYAWSLGDLIGALVESFGTVEITVEHVEEKKEETDGEGLHQ